MDRAGHGYGRWAELVAQAGYCHHPIRLAGRVEHADRTTGEVRQVYDSEREPDGVLLKACGTRRESRCPSCAATYRADAYQLLAAGLKGGKGVPETVASHPRLFVTFTAPSFGRVHSRKAQGRLVLPCHPYRQGARCPHGLPDGCWHRHDEDDPRLGEPLCPGCYDARAQVLWNALAPELWRRTTIALQRALGRLVGLQEAELRRLVHISYAKVAEFQRRGAIHFHAVIRLDAATECRCPGCLAPPPDPFTAGLLEDALRQAVPAVRVPCPQLDDGGPARYARWGEQLDVRNITHGDEQAGELSAEQVAGYIAKYATKATEGFGVRPGPAPRGRRPGPPRQAARACGRARPGRLGAGQPPPTGRPAAAGMGAHARVRRALVNQEPPLLDHLHRAPACAGRVRQAPPGPRRHPPGRL